MKWKKNNIFQCSLDQRTYGAKQRINQKSVHFYSTITKKKDPFFHFSYWSLVILEVLRNWCCKEMPLTFECDKPTNNCIINSLILAMIIIVITIYNNVRSHMSRIIALKLHYTLPISHSWQPLFCAIGPIFGRWKGW